MERVCQPINIGHFDEHDNERKVFVITTNQRVIKIQSISDSRTKDHSIITCNIDSMNTNCTSFHKSTTTIHPKHRRKYKTVRIA